MLRGTPYNKKTNNNCCKWTELDQTEHNANNMRLDKMGTQRSNLNSKNLNVTLVVKYPDHFIVSTVFNNLTYLCCYCLILGTLYVGLPPVAAKPLPFYLGPKRVKRSWPHHPKRRSCKGTKVPAKRNVCINKFLSWLNYRHSLSRLRSEGGNYIPNMVWNLSGKNRKA